MLANLHRAIKKHLGESVPEPTIWVGTDKVKSEEDWKDGTLRTFAIGNIGKQTKHYTVYKASHTFIREENRAGNGLGWKKPKKPKRKVTSESATVSEGTESATDKKVTELRVETMRFEGPFSTVAAKATQKGKEWAVDNVKEACYKGFLEDLRKIKEWRAALPIYPDSDAIHQEIHVKQHEECFVKLINEWYDSMLERAHMLTKPAQEILPEGATGANGGGNSGGGPNSGSDSSGPEDSENSPKNEDDTNPRENSANDDGTDDARSKSEQGSGANDAAGSAGEKNELKNHPDGKVESDGRFENCAGGDGNDREAAASKPSGTVQADPPAMEYSNLRISLQETFTAASDGAHSVANDSTAHSSKRKYSSATDGNDAVSETRSTRPRCGSPSDFQIPEEIELDFSSCSDSDSRWEDDRWENDEQTDDEDEDNPNSELLKQKVPQIQPDIYTEQPPSQKSLGKLPGAMKPPKPAASLNTKLPSLFDSKAEEARTLESRRHGSIADSNQRSSSVSSKISRGQQKSRPEFINSKAPRRCPSAGSHSLSLSDGIKSLGDGISRHVTAMVMMDPFGDKSSYTGCISTSTGLPDGFGRIEFHNKAGRWYEGNWIQGQWTGRGCLSSGSGDFYEGGVKHDFKHGKGTMRFADGRVFEGEYVKGQMVKGKMTYQDGSTYTGGWVDGMWHGRGQCVFRGESVYEGEFKEGQFCGRGKMAWNDGVCYEGEWRDGDMHGMGREVRADGSIRHDGEWVHCQPIRRNKKETEMATV